MKKGKKASAKTPVEETLHMIRSRLDEEKIEYENSLTRKDEEDNEFHLCYGTRIRGIALDEEIEGLTVDALITYIVTDDGLEEDEVDDIVGKSIVDDLQQEYPGREDHFIGISLEYLDEDEECGCSDCADEDEECGCASCTEKNEKYMEEVAEEIIELCQERGLTQAEAVQLLGDVAEGLLYPLIRKHIKERNLLKQIISDENDEDEEEYTPEKKTRLDYIM